MMVTGYGATGKHAGGTQEGTPRPPRTRSSTALPGSMRCPRLKSARAASTLPRRPSTTPALVSMRTLRGKRSSAARSRFMAASSAHSPAAH